MDDVITEDIYREYIKMQKDIVSGRLICSKEEAATLAAVQLRLEAWPEENLELAEGKNYIVLLNGQENIKSEKYNGKNKLVIRDHLNRMLLLSDSLHYLCPFFNCCIYTQTNMMNSYHSPDWGFRSSSITDGSTEGVAKIVSANFRVRFSLMFY